MRATFALIETLRREGHAIDAGRGLYRPLIDRAGETSTESFWRDRLGTQLAFDWHPRAPAMLGLRDDVPALYLPEPGWVAAPSLLQALRAASGATIVTARVASLATHGANGGVGSATATLDDGTRIDARSLLWCGGAWGAAGLDHAAASRSTGVVGGGAARDAVYKPGSLLWTDAALTAVPLSFGLYLVPCTDPSSDVPAGRPAGVRTHRGTHRGTLLGPTREGSQPTFPEGEVAPVHITRLQDRVAGHFGRTIALAAAWRGVRLARLSTGAAQSLDGIATLTALGSRGFLCAPLYAARWARSL